MQRFTQKHAEIFVIDKLRSRRYFGKHQLLAENIPKGKPPEHRKIIMKAIKSLANKGFLITKKKHYGVHVSLDPRKIKAIREHLEKLESELE